MTKTLNPTLFRRLTEVFRHVRVSNPGQPAVIHYQPDWQYRRGRLRPRVVGYGETYYVSCPFCTDIRRRLGISHRWAVDDRETYDDMLHLAHCFNEECLATREMQKKLHAMVYPQGMYGRAMKVELPRSVQPAEPAPEPEFHLPPHTPLSELPAGHPAIRYVRKRGFNPKMLARRWGVVYCEENRGPSPHFLEPRIVIPVYAPRAWDDEQPARLVGWQARSIGRSIHRMPKYLSALGMRRNDRLYGLPQALKTQGPIVIVEGITDVWRLERRGVGLFGKVMSQAQVRLLRRYCDNRPIVVLPDQDVQEQARTIVQQLRPYDFPRVVAGKLPNGRKDPGECSCEGLRAAIEDAIS